MISLHIPLFDVDAVAVDGGTEAEGVARAPARRDDAFPIKNYCVHTASLLETQAGFVDPPKLCRRFHKALVKVVPVANLPGG